MLQFADAIGAKRRLGADEAGNPRIEGKFGRVYVQPRTCNPGRVPKFQLYFLPGHPMRWSHTRAVLGKFARVTNGSAEGADEGMLLMERFPSLAEGEVIRDRLGAHKRVEYSDEVLAAKRESIVRATAARKGAAAAALEQEILDGEEGLENLGLPAAPEPQEADPPSPSGGKEDPHSP